MKIGISVIVFLFICLFIIVLTNNYFTFCTRQEYNDINYKTAVDYNFSWHNPSIRHYFDVDQQRCLKVSFSHGCCIRNGAKQVQTLRHYEFKNLDNEKVMKEFMNKVNGKTILFAGDSLTLQTVESVVFLLSNITYVQKVGHIFYNVFKDGSFSRIDKCRNDFQTQLSSCGKNCTCNVITKYYIVETNTTLLYYDFYTLFDKSYKALYHSSNWVNDKTLVQPFPLAYYFIFGSVDLLEHFIINSDHAIVNIGLHEEMLAPYEYVFKVRHVIDILQKNAVMRNTKHLFRLTLPQHFENGEYWSAKKPTFQPVPRHWSDTVARGVYNEKKPTNVELVDWYYIFSGAWFLHSRDHTHYCYTHHLWIPAIDILNQHIK